MDPWVVALTLAAMLVGLVGTIVPMLPGLLLVWAAAVGSLWWQGLDGTGWAAVVVLTVMFVGATAAKIALPARGARAQGAPRRSLLVAAAASLVGFFVIPVVGLLVGGVLGLYLAERARLHDGAAAWRTTRRALVDVGLATLLEVVTGMAMIAVWVGMVIAS